jgi:SAM-dependent methyltransferase
MLLDEYKNQNTWRDWEKYLNNIPLSKNQTVYDLGCSIGFVANLLSYKVKRVIGFDNNSSLLEEASRNKSGNCEFIIENIFTLDPRSLGNCDGIWMSYTMAYMEDPNYFISNWAKCLNTNGWFAIVDVDGLFSSHLQQNSRFYKEIELFEQHSALSKIYDFRIGRKIKNMLEQNGLDIMIAEDNWYDKELNFCGNASLDIIEAWEKRLDRMLTLKSYLGASYIEFSKEFINIISKEDHKSYGGVKFYVGIKK